MASPILTTLSLCSGVGGLELGVASVVRTRVLCFVERDGFAASVLLARMEDAALEPAPVFCGDLGSFDCGPFVGAVDLITAGIPCQPFSVAGQRRGLEDERWIWPAVARIIREVGPRLVFLENTPQIVGHGLPVILGTLAGCGFDAVWDRFSAADVGAPHRRERFFLLAHADGAERWPGDERGGRGSEGGNGARPAPGGPWLRCGSVGNAHRPRQQRPGHAAPGGLGFPPGPGDSAGWRAWLAAGGPPPAVRRVRGDVARLSAGVDEPFRFDRLRALGNACVPAQAALAFRVLAGRLFQLDATAQDQHTQVQAAPGA